MAGNKESTDISFLQKEISVDILRREKQIQQILQLVVPSGDDSLCEPLPPSIFIHGLASTGKEFVVTSILNKLNYHYAVINCIECYTQKLLFEPIINQLTNHQISSDDNFASYAKCDNLMDFLYHLQVAAKSLQFEENASFIILENCERLRDLNDNLLPAFLRLHELTQINICVFFLSDVAFEKFVLKSSLFKPIEIFFPQYTQDDVVDILSLYHPKDYPAEFYRNYLTMLVSVFYRECRDLIELQRMAALNFVKYCEPVASGKLQMNDSNKLWRHLNPYLKTSLGELHLKTSVRSESDGYQVNGVASTAKSALSYELPYYTKYLLIAAYLASYNPEKYDKRIFFKCHKKEKKRASTNKVKNLYDHNLGPRLFSLDRLLAIFYTILGERLTLTVNLQSQVSSLVKLQLLTLVSDNCLESPKLKCAVSLAFIKIIAQTLQFNVTKYLYNFT